MTNKPGTSTLKRHQLTAMGLCWNCGKQPPVPNNKKCAACILQEAQRPKHAKALNAEQRKRYNAWRKQQRLNWVTAGICPDCGKRPAALPAQRCTQCLNAVATRMKNSGRKHNTATQLKEQQRRRRARRLSAGRCVSCGGPAELERTRCKVCLAKETNRKKTPEHRQRGCAQVKQYYHRLRKQVIEHYTKGTYRCMCPYCTTEGLEFLTLDHANNDGNAHRKKIKPGIALFSWCISNNYPPSIQVLCWNCNEAKQHYGAGVCPHVTKHQGSAPAV